jgi:uncharacterized membrane protein
MNKPPIAISTRILLYTIAAFLSGFAAGPAARSAETGSPVVHAVLFASPTCSHCAKVKNEVLPPLVSRYGSQLQIAIVDTHTPSGNELFLTACMQYGLLRLSVPLLVVGNTTLVGSEEIPAKFPQLIGKCIAEGGVGWPNIPGLNAMLAENLTTSPEIQFPAEPPVTKPALSENAGVIQQKPVEPLPSPASTHGPSSNGVVPPPPAVHSEPSSIIDLTGGEPETGVLGRIKRDIYGNGLAILILVGMVLTLLVSWITLRKPVSPVNPVIKPRWYRLIPVLALAGLGVAAYLSHVEVQNVEAVCGPVGDCNTVNQSEYARLFGIIPVGVLGLIGFFAILTGWMLQRWGSRKISLWATVSLLGMSGFGTVFSIYLTFLEPFVIGATCLWCLSSATIMTVIYALALRPGRQAWSALSR